MATLTPGRVFHLTQRFVLASRGTMVRLTAPLSRNSVGLVRPTHGSCGLLKTEQTAGLNEWPPDRRDMDKNASPHPQSMLQQAISAVTYTATPERQRNQIQTAPSGQSQTYRTPCEPDKEDRSTIQKPTGARTTGPPDTCILSRIPERNLPQARSETDRHMSKPPPAPPMSQSKGRRPPTSSPRGAKLDSVEKATPPQRRQQLQTDQSHDATSHTRS